MRPQGKGPASTPVRLVPSIAPWLPWLKGLLPYTVLLGGKAAELYYFSILERPAPPLLIRDTVFGLGIAGKASRALHEHLLSQGFRTRTVPGSGRSPARPSYHREDLGSLEFRRAGSSRGGGLSAVPDPWLDLLREDPHAVELRYLREKYTVRIPQTGRFILACGLSMGTRRRANPEERFRASENLLLILYLLVPSPELQEEALDDLEGFKPRRSIQELAEALRANGPGTAVWESVQKAYLRLFPGTLAVELTNWYWRFLPAVAKRAGN